MEKEGITLPKVEYPFKFAEDAKAVRSKLEQIEAGIQTLDDPQKSGKFYKLESKLHHVLGRLNRSPKMMHRKQFALNCWQKFYRLCPI